MSGPSRRDQNNKLELLHSRGLCCFCTGVRSTSGITTKLKDASRCSIIHYSNARARHSTSVLTSYVSKRMMLKIEPGSDFGSLVWTHNVTFICYNDSMSVIVFVKTDEGRIYKINKRLEL